MRMTRSRSLIGTTLVLGIAIGLAKSAGIATEVIIAARVGVGPAFDSYSVVLTLTLLITGLIGGSLAGALVPAFIKVRSIEGQDESERLLGAVMMLYSLLSGVVILLVLAFEGPLFALLSGKSSDVLERHILWRLSLTIPLAGIAILLTAALNSLDHYGAPAAAQVTVPLGALLGLELAPKGGVSSLALGMLGGYFAYTLLLCLMARTAGIRLGLSSSAIKNVVTNMLPQTLAVGAGSLIVGVAPVVDNAVASNIGSGAVSTLQYGGRFTSFVLGVGSLAVGGAILPHVSRIALQDSRLALKRSVIRIVALIVLGSVPLVLGLILFGPEMVRLVYQHGRLGPNAARGVISVQRLSALQIPAYLANIALVRVLFALRKSRVLLLISVVNALVNLSLDVVLSRAFGVAGIALADAGLYTASSLGIALYLMHRLKRPSMDGERTADQL